MKVQNKIQIKWKVNDQIKKNMRIIQQQTIKFNLLNNTEENLNIIKDDEKIINKEVKLNPENKDNKIQGNNLKMIILHLKKRAKLLVAKLNKQCGV